MTHKISDSCILCGKCAEICPEGAIHQGETQYEIEADKCTDCNLCVPVCEVGAIEPPDGEQIEVSESTLE
jgi:ferredoxin